MSFITIDVDGALHVHSGQPTADTVREHIGDWDMVALPVPANRMRAFLDDAGHLVGMPINVVGSLVLITCGARQMPYAGTVLITGWDEHSNGPEIDALDDVHVQLVRDLHRDITAVLAGEAAVGDDLPADWPAIVRNAAAQLQAAPRPALRLLTGDDAINFLRGAQR